MNRTAPYGLGQSNSATADRRHRAGKRRSDFTGLGLAPRRTAGIVPAATSKEWNGGALTQLKAALPKSGLRMPIVIRHHADLEANRVEFSGAVSLPELRATAGFFAAEPDWLAFDCLNLICPQAHFDAVERAEVDRLFSIYRAGFERAQRPIVRRSAWLCLSPRAHAMVAYWVAGRAVQEAAPIDIKLVESFDAAALWLVLTGPERAALESGEGFAEVARFDLPAALVR